jgi:hypothetical protein
MCTSNAKNVLAWLGEDTRYWESFVWIHNVFENELKEFKLSKGEEYWNIMALSDPTKPYF